MAVLTLAAPAFDTYLSIYRPFGKILDTSELSRRSYVDFQDSV